jgi:hypothetical protein
MTDHIQVADGKGGKVIIMPLTPVDVDQQIAIRLAYHNIIVTVWTLNHIDPFDLAMVNTDDDLLTKKCGVIPRERLIRIVSDMQELLAKWLSHADKSRPAGVPNKTQRKVYGDLKILQALWHDLMV